MILALEANSLVHIMYHISEEKPPDPADVVERFLNRLVYIREYALDLAARVNEPCRLIAVFDGKSKVFRADVFTDYKAHRTPDLLVYECVDHAREAVKHSDEWLEMTSPDGYEADDTIASICAKADERVLIHSSDKDFHQCLVSGRVGIIKKSGVEQVITGRSLGLGGIAIPQLVTKDFTHRDLVREFGFGADRWIDYQCLVGDSADNVNGAIGIGDKGARKLLLKYNKLEDVDPDEAKLNKKQKEHWPEFLERLEDLRNVFTLRTNL